MSEIKPDASYQWKETDVFTLNGKEFEIFLNSTRAILAHPDSQKVLLVAKLAEILENKMLKAIEEGVVTEALPSEEVPTPQPTAE
jgi:hypothetical protein